MSSVELSSCCSCFVFRQWFALKWVKFSAILYSLPKQLNLIPRSSRLTVQFPVNFPARLMWSLQYRKILPNLVDSSWLWWIMHGILANQKQRNILHEYQLTYWNSPLHALQLKEFFIYQYLVTFHWTKFFLNLHRGNYNHGKINTVKGSMI